MRNDLIRQLFAAIDAREWSTLGEYFHPDVIYERPGYTAIEGIEQLTRFYQDVRVISSGAHALEGIVVDGEYGACWGRFTGVGRDDADLDERFADVYRFEDGRIRERRSHFFRPAI